MDGVALALIGFPTEVLMPSAQRHWRVDITPFDFLEVTYRVRQYYKGHQYIYSYVVINLVHSVFQSMTICGGNFAFLLYECNFG